MHFALCKEQQHSQKHEFFVIMVQLKLLRVSKPAGLTVCIFFSLSVHFVCSSEFSVKETVKRDGA
jgi:hypothetical protein